MASHPANYDRDEWNRFGGDEREHSAPAISHSSNASIAIDLPLLRRWVRTVSASPRWQADLDRRRPGLSHISRSSLSQGSGKLRTAHASQSFANRPLSQASFFSLGDS